MYKVVQISPVQEDWNNEDFKKIVILFLTLNVVNFWSQKLAWTYCQCLEFAIIVHFNRLFMLTLAIKTKTCVMALVILARSKFSPNLIEILVPYI